MASVCLYPASTLLIIGSRRNVIAAHKTINGPSTVADIYTAHIIDDYYAFSFGMLECRQSLFRTGHREDNPYPVVQFPLLIFQKFFLHVVHAGPPFEQTIPDSLQNSEVFLHGIWGKTLGTLYHQYLGEYYGHGLMNEGIVQPS